MTDELPVGPGILVGNPMMIWCADHLEPFRRDWPAGYLPASLALLHQAMLRDDIQAAAGGRVEALNGVLREYGPLCCLVDRETVAEIVRLALGPTGPDAEEGVAELLRRYGPPPTRRPG